MENIRYYKDDITFYTKVDYIKDSYIPQYKRKYNKNGYIMNEAQQDNDLISGFPINKPMKFNENLMIKAINNGMIILLNYSGDQDNWKGGRERVIYPMVLGVNRNTGNMLLRAWHLEGWSVKNRRFTQNVWRLFKTVNIKTMMFTGDFFRLAPKGYRSNDRVMTERTIISADFNTIRRNQQTLLNSNKIQLQREQTIGFEDDVRIVKIDIRNTDTKINLVTPWNNKYINNKNKIKLTILKTVFGNRYIAIIGAKGTPNRVVKVFEDKTLLGNFKVIDYLSNNELNKKTNVDGIREFDLYTFNRLILP